MGVELSHIFNQSKQGSLFVNKSVLQTNYTPDTVPHRNTQIEQIASILAPSLQGNKPSNLFLYGKTGTGKTLSIHYVKNELLKHVAKDASFQLKITYLNCKLRKVSDTEYRILAELIKKMGGSVPATGLPTESVYSRFLEMLDAKPMLMILILDEIDYAVQKISDSFLYNILRLNSELTQSQLCLVGISNDLTFLDNLDPRVKSSLSEEELVFPPYNALQLKDILGERADVAFKQGSVGEGVIAKCAALAAREHGDARRALDLIRIAGELCEREGGDSILLKHLDHANEKMERDKILDVVRSEPQQFQLVLLAIIHLTELKKQESVFTGDIFQMYQELCVKNKSDVLTPRRVSDIIMEFDMLGLINSRVVSKGRGGRMREITLVIPLHIIDKAKEILHESLLL